VNRSMPRGLQLVSLLCLAGLALAAPGAQAQSPELSLREFASGQIKKGVRSIGFGGDGATWGNYALVYRDAGTALLDGGVTAFDNGNDFTFTAVGFTSPALWHGLAIYAIALSQRATDLRLSLKSPGLGPMPRAAVGQGSDQAIFVKAALPLGAGFSAGVLLSYELSQFDATSADPAQASVRYQTAWRPSGGFGVVWQHADWLLCGVRAILNHDLESRIDSAGRVDGMSQSFEGRAGISVSPWKGLLLDAGGTLLAKSNAIAGTRSSALHPNLGIEQAFFDRRFVLRAGLDETSPGAGITLRLPPLQLDLAYVRSLAAARTGTLFGDGSNSVIGTLTYDYLL
jgi:hypothetical protein